MFAFTRTAFHNAYIYRLDFWVRLLSFFILMYATYSLWTILYQQVPDAFGMDLERMTTYGVLGILLMSFMDSARFIQWYIADHVRQGVLELDIMKPLDFVFHMFCRSIGDFWVLMLTHGIAGLLFAVFFLNFQPPVNLQAGLVFVLSVSLGYLIYFQINLLMGLVSIVTLDIRSYSWVFWSVVRFTSGQLVPLWMFPPALAAIVAALPFKDIYYTPMAIYVGMYEGNFASPLLSQTAWAVGLFFVTRIAWERVQRRIVVQGG